MTYYVCFDTVSFFAMLPVGKTLEQLSEIFSKKITKLFEQSLTTTCFQWISEFYEEFYGVAMGSPISPVIVNFYIQM